MASIINDNNHVNNLDEEKKLKIVLVVEETKLRIANYCHFRFNSPSYNIGSKTRCRKLFKNGYIQLNNELVEASRIPKIGDIISIDLDGINSFDMKNCTIYDRKIDVLYEDEHLAVVNKPAGLITNGNFRCTLQNCLSSNLKESNEKTKCMPKPMHRLDLMTGGVVLIGKTRNACMHLGKQFENHTVRKRYKAILIGCLNSDSGTITSDIDGRHAETYYKVVSRTKSLHTDWITTVDLFPKTGRKHQLRIHMARDLGHPIVGDKVHTPENKLKQLYLGKGMFLRALEINFIHPIATNCKMVVKIEIPEPAKFEYYRNMELKRFQKLKQNSQMIKINNIDKM